MTLRVLLDEGLPLRAALILRDSGIDVVHVSEVGLSSTPDADIMAFGVAEDRVCVTLDHDFHRILAQTGDARPSVVLLRLQGMDHIATAGLIDSILRSFALELEQGAALTANQRGVRLRKLPLP